jgi:hypothetical protein
MDYIWTHWTKPQNGIISLFDTALLALSVSLATRHGTARYISTDSLGAKHIEKFHIEAPINVSLDHLHNEDISKWAISKIDTFSKVTSPCVHIDHDVFLWKQQKNSKADFCCQTLEQNEFYSTYYSNCIQKAGGEELWPYFQKTFKEHTLCGYNMGYVQINNVEFLKKYTKESFNIYNKIKINHRSQNIIPEQYLFYCMTHSDPSITVETLIKHPLTAEHQNTQCNKLGYTHLMGEKFGNRELIYCKAKNKLSILNPKCLEELLKEESKTKTRFIKPTPLILDKIKIQNRLNI